MNVQLRPFQADEYPVLVELLNSVWPEHPTTAERLREDDAARPTHFSFERWLAWQGERPVGYGVFGNSEDSYHPQKFWLTLGVGPEHRGKGVGRQVYDHLLARLEPHNPVLLTGWAREDETCRVRFFQARGFEEAMRGFESRLSVAACDLAPFAVAEAALRERGIMVKTLRELEQDADYQRKVYELHITLDADVPATEPYTPPSFETFAKRHFESSRLVKESFFVAVKDGEYIGMSELWRSDADPDLHTGLTGVRREYRRMGVALALKVAGVRFAKANGYPEIRTWNAAHNRGMLAINERLGFVKRPASITFRKRLQEPSGQSKPG